MSDEATARGQSHHLRIGAPAPRDWSSTVKNMVSTWQSQDVQATQADGICTRNSTAWRARSQTCRSQLAVAIKDVAELKPFVDAFENAKTQAQGAQNSAS